MASSINPSNVDGTYPVAGQDNDSQGFRDNFTNIKTNFTSAKTEIEALQTTSVTLSATNDFNFTGVISEALMKNNADVVNALGSVTAVAMDHATATIHTATLSASGTVSFTNWPASLLGGRMRLVVTISNVAHTLTLPAAVTLGADTVQGISSLVITFPATGTYIYDFSTVDGGTSVLVEDKTQSDASLGNIQINLNTITSTNTNGNIALTPNGTGQVVITKADINSGTFDGIVGGTTPAAVTTSALVATTADINAGTFDGIVGGTTPAAGSFTTLGASGALTGTLGTAAQGNVTSLGTLTVLAVDNLSFDANTITTTNANGDLGLNPNGTGTVDFSVPVQTTVGAAGGAAAVPATPTTYMKIEVGGTAYVVPCFAVS